MTHAFELLIKTITRKVPPRTLGIAILNKLHCWPKTGNRKHEWNRLYLENPDPFNYQFAAYERRKYHKTLETVLKWRSGAESVLELGCSIGVFTQMLANYFVRVTALDISNEACGVETFAHRMKVSIKGDGTNRDRSGDHRRAHVEKGSCVRNRFRMG